ncbi:hypothetical protein [Nocardia mangyaensis]|uniref:hypothetical protein n=1 Tax=Nocardia mangyaensis TaxID=2213200 RepID=UPI00267653F0|nr:hypothetical protein [Nocardia mangyaensis]MDO3651331.1 hypothetical protein [Nocardia mangyaensis]
MNATDLAGRNKKKLAVIPCTKTLGVTVSTVTDRRDYHPLGFFRSFMGIILGVFIGVLVIGLINLAHCCYALHQLKPFDNDPNVDNNPEAIDVFRKIAKRERFIIYPIIHKMAEEDCEFDEYCKKHNIL